MNEYLIQLVRNKSFIKATFQLFQILLMNNDSYTLISKNLDFKYHIYFKLYLIFFDMSKNFYNGLLRFMWSLHQ